MTSFNSFNKKLFANIGNVIVIDSVACLLLEVSYETRIESKRSRAIKVFANLSTR